AVAFDDGVLVAAHSADREWSARRARDRLPVRAMTSFVIVHDPYVGVRERVIGLRRVLRLCGCAPRLQVGYDLADLVAALVRLAAERELRILREHARIHVRVER